MRMKFLLYSVEGQPKCFLQRMRVPGFADLVMQSTLSLTQQKAISLTQQKAVGQLSLVRNFDAKLPVAATGMRKHVRLR